MTVKRWVSAIVPLVFLFLAGCSSLGNNANEPLKASRTTSIVSIQVAPEISGKSAQIKVAQGDQVHTKDVLFELDDRLLQAQVD
jgi:multidrug efflux pump subunit AcrA (membrane-fusion protein)